jgi:hypothetical protein
VTRQINSNNINDTKEIVIFFLAKKADTIPLVFCKPLSQLFLKK